MQKILMRIRNAAAGVFIAVNVAIIVIGALPNKSYLDNKLLDFLAPYWVAVGLEQGWSMFAPNPPRENYYIDADLFFTDGSKERWAYPRASRMTDRERVLGGERFRKLSESLYEEGPKEVWLDLSRFVWRDVEKLEASGKHRQLKGIQFYRNVSSIKPPQEKFVDHGVLSSNYQPNKVYYFDVAWEISHENSKRN